MRYMELNDKLELASWRVSGNVRSLLGGWGVLRRIMDLSTCHLHFLATSCTSYPRYPRRAARVVLVMCWARA